MDQFKRDCRIDSVACIGIPATDGAIHQQDEERPKALAAPIDQVVTNFSNQTLARVEQTK